VSYYEDHGMEQWVKQLMHGVNGCMASHSQKDFTIRLNAYNQPTDAWCEWLHGVS